MRISDWSSDVCSSDLLGRGVRRRLPAVKVFRPVRLIEYADQHDAHARLHRMDTQHRVAYRQHAGVNHRDHIRCCGIACQLVEVFVGRSEEHTSELQSLMRRSYADFCLKKKRQKQKSNSIITK